MASTSEYLASLNQKVNGLQSRIIGVSPNAIIFAAAGEFVAYGCKVTQGASADDLTIALEGSAPGDEANHNPKSATVPARQFQYPNIASLADGAFLSTDTTTAVDTPPAAGFGRYDIAFVYSGPTGPGFAISTGTPSESVKTDFDTNGLRTTPYDHINDAALPVGALPVARIYVEGGATGIADDRIADIRDFSGRLRGESFTYDDLTPAQKDELVSAGISDVTALKESAEAAAGTATSKAGEAAAARDMAHEWAEKPEDEEVGADQYSALHHAAKAGASANTAASAATTATEKAEQAALDRVATGEDRTATGEDRTAVADDRAAVETAKDEIVADRAKLELDSGYMVPIGSEILWPVNVDLPAGWEDTYERLPVGSAEKAILTNWNLQRGLFDPLIPGTILSVRPEHLYLDSDLTELVTSPGDPVGGVLDLSGNGYHATQPVSADRPIYGIEPEGGRRNLLERTETFDASWWILPSEFSVAISDAVLTIEHDAEFVSSTNVGRVQNSPQSQSVIPDGLGEQASASALVKVHSGYAYVGFGNPGGSRMVVARVDTLGNVTQQSRASNTEQITITSEPAEDGYVKITVSGQSANATSWAGLRFIFCASAASNVQDIVTGPCKASVKFPQHEGALAPTPYQRVTTQYNVTESGKRSLHYLSHNLINQSTTRTLPAGSYTIALAGNNGIWIDTVEHAGGAFNVGPTTYTGGPDGILEVIGQRLYGGTIVEGVLSATQRARVVSYFKSLGAPGVFELGPELFGTVDLTDGVWIEISSTIVGPNTYTVTATGQGVRRNSDNNITVGTLYCFDVQLSTDATGPIGVQLYNGGVTSQLIASKTGTSAISLRSSARPETTQLYLRVSSINDAGVNITINSLSIRRLELIP